MITFCEGDLSSLNFELLEVEAKVVDGQSLRILNGRNLKFFKFQQLLQLFLEYLSLIF